MRVAIFNSLYYPDIKGGAEISVKVLAESLQLLGHEVFVICSSDQPRYRNIQGVHVLYLPPYNIYPFKDSRKKPFLLKVIWHLQDLLNALMIIRIWWVVRWLKPDILHTNNLAGLSIAPWIVGKALKIPVVHTIRDYQLLCIMQGSMFRNEETCRRQCLRCRLLSGQKRWLSGRVDYVVGNSRFVLDRHLRTGVFPSAKVRVIYNSYENPRQRRNRVIREKVRFGFIGRLDPLKGVDLLIDAFRAADIASVADLFIAGNGLDAYVQDLKARAANMPVRFLGVAEAADFFDEVDVVIVPSLWEEPLSRVIFEAYAHGKPVLGSRRGGTPEIVMEGRTGFLFDPGVPAELAGLLKKISHDQTLVSALSDQCLDKAKEFLPSQLVKDYLEVYRSSLNGSRYDRLEGSWAGIGRGGRLAIRRLTRLMR